MAKYRDYCPIAAGVEMRRWLLGLVPFRELVNSGHARLLGPSCLARAFPTWFDTALFSDGLRLGQERPVRQGVGV